MLEGDIEKALVAFVENLGGECRKFVDPGRRGAPDRIVLLPYQMIFVETKAPSGRLEPWQIRYHAMLRKYHQTVEVPYTVEHVALIVERLKCNYYQRYRVAPVKAIWGSSK